MKRTFGIVFGVMLLFFTVTLWAQKNKKKTASAKSSGAKTEKIVPVAYKAYKTPIPVYLGHSDISNGDVPKKVVDSLLRKGLSGKDSSGVEYKVDGFNFTYAERNIYEDSTGGLVVLCDYMIEHCDGDTLSTAIAASIYDRTKAGDTIYVDHVKLVRPDNETAMGRTLKVVIIK